MSERIMAVFDFGGVREEVVSKREFPLAKALRVLKDDVVAVLGYGVQGPAQALNLRDAGVNVIVGQRKGRSYQKALKHGWVPKRNLFGYEEAARKGTIIEYLLSDAGQKEQWPIVKPYLSRGKTLYFSHGFSITYEDQTGVVPPKISMSCWLLQKARAQV